MRTPHRVVSADRGTGLACGLGEHGVAPAALAAHPWGVAPPIAAGEVTAKDSVEPLSTSVPPAPPRVMVWLWPLRIKAWICSARTSGSTVPGSSYPVCPADGPVAVGR